MAGPTEGAGGPCPYADLQGQDQHRLSRRLLTASMTTPIDVNGEHVFVSPSFTAGDQRGPCPGLNSLANHGYIPHNGIVSFTGAITAINEVFGMALDLSTVLAVMGTVWVGDPVSLDPSFSIAGETAAVQNILGNGLGLFGTPQGLIGSHNFIEADSSNTRNDLYLTGDNYRLQMDQFMEWYRMSDDPVGDYNMDLMALRAKNRFDESVAQNPNFYYGPITGLLARNAGFVFPRLMGNHSSENPKGTLTKQTIKSFYAIYGEEGNFEYKEGWEAIPQNWYRAPVDYSLAQLNLDISGWVAMYPELGSIGGNTGTVKSFTGVDLGNMTGGVYNAGTLLQGNNLLCFVFEAMKFMAPDSLSPLFSSLGLPMQLVNDALAAPLLSLACPALKDLTVGGKSLWDGLQELYPGAAMSGRAL